MSTMIDQFKRTTDPFGRGSTTHDLLGAGYPLTRGLVYPYPDGGVVLRRRRLYPTAGAWSICGFARPGETAIKNSQGFAHEPDMAFQYSAAEVLGNGFTSSWSQPVRVDFDNVGDQITPALPMWPVNIIALTVAAGKYRVCFEYIPYGQGEWPTDFQVFEGADAASVDYNTPLVDSITSLSAMPFTTTKSRFIFTTPAYADASSHVFAVRARNSGGVAEKNVNTTKPKTARSTTIALTKIENVIARRG